MDFIQLFAYKSSVNKMINSWIYASQNLRYFQILSAFLAVLSYALRFLSANVDLHRHRYLLHQLYRQISLLFAKGHNHGMSMILYCADLSEIQNKYKPYYSEVFERHTCSICPWVGVNIEFGTQKLVKQKFFFDSVRGHQITHQISTTHWLPTHAV